MIMIMIILGSNKWLGDLGLGRNRHLSWSLQSRFYCNQSCNQLAGLDASGILWWSGVLYNTHDYVDNDCCSLPPYFTPNADMHKTKKKNEIE